MESTTEHLEALLHRLEEQPESRAQLRLLLFLLGWKPCPDVSSG